MLAGRAAVANGSVSVLQRYSSCNNVQEGGPVDEVRNEVAGAVAREVLDVYEGIERAEWRMGTM